VDDELQSKDMADSVAEATSQPSAGPTFWGRLKMIGLIALCVVLAGLGGIGVALGLLQSPSG
jgi:hypothetical protein